VVLAVVMFAIAPGQRLSAQLQVSQLHGRVIDSQAGPIAGATVSLLDPAGNAIRRTISEADGSFRIADVAPGSYIVRVELAGLVVLTRTLVVRGSLPVELTLQTGPTVAESIVVRGDAGSNTTERPWTLAGDAVREVGEPLPSQRVQAALAGLPGWMSEDNGLLHVRGVDDGLLYVQDGIPVYARLDRLFGMPPNPSAIASLHILNGYIPPEFGFKSGAVVEVRTETGIRNSWSGTFDTGVADLGTRHLEGFASGPVGRGLGLMLTGSDERSSRFLDPGCAREFPQPGPDIQRRRAGDVQPRQESALPFVAGRPRGIRRSTQSRAGSSRTGSTSANDTDAAGGILAARALDTDRLANVLLRQTKFGDAQLVSR
jgi:Carboxypeptidase regulatory-like domain